MQKKRHKEDEQESNRNYVKTKDHKQSFQNSWTKARQWETTHIPLCFKYTGNPGHLVLGHLALSFSPAIHDFLSVKSEIHVKGSLL